MNFTVAIVGRPNVGKSTLFNRLVGKKLALVDDTPGVTRDRRPGDAKLVDLRFTIIDTAGLEQSGPETLQGRMWLQTEAAIEEADLTLFVVDAKYGLTPADETLGKMLRRRGKPVVLVANKSEAKGSDGGYYDAFTLGLGEPVAISAEHGQGMIDLRDAIVAALGEDRAFPPEIDEPETNVDLRGEEDLEDDDYEPEYDDTKPLRVAIIGRPNAGKSTLINRFLGEDRLLTGPEAGITRDSISVEWDWRGRTIKMFDTAGMRKKARVQEKLEKLSVADSLRSIRFAESVVIVFDATIPFEKQDLQLVDLVRGPEGVPGGPHRLDPVFALEPAHQEVPAGDALEVLQEQGVDQGPSGGAEDRDRLGRDLLGDHQPETRGDGGDQADQGRRARVGGAPAGQVAQGVGDHRGEGRAHAEVAGLGPIVGLGRAAQGEDLQASEARLELARVLALAARDVGDRTQHQRRRQGQLEGHGGQAPRTAQGSAAGDGQLVQAVPRRALPLPQGAHRRIECLREGLLGRPLHGAAPTLGQGGEAALQGRAQGVREADRQARPLQQGAGEAQVSLGSGRKGVLLGIGAHGESPVEGSSVEPVGEPGRRTTPV